MSMGLKKRKRVKQKIKAPQLLWSTFQPKNRFSTVILTVPQASPFCAHKEPYNAGAQVSPPSTCSCSVLSAPLRGPYKHRTELASAPPRSSAWQLILKVWPVQALLCSQLLAQSAEFCSDSPKWQTFDPKQLLMFQNQAVWGLHGVKSNGVPSLLSCFVTLVPLPLDRHLQGGKTRFRFFLQTLALSGSTRQSPWNSLTKETTPCLLISLSIYDPRHFSHWRYFDTLSIASPTQPLMVFGCTFY